MVPACHGQCSLDPDTSVHVTQRVRQVDEDEFGGLRGLAEVLLGYGERHFEGAPGQKGGRRGVWTGVLLMCGQFERVSENSIVDIHLLTLHD